MKIDGREIAASLLQSLSERVRVLHNTHCIPHLAIILLGQDPASTSYVNQKVQKAEMIGAKATVYSLDEKTTQQDLLTLLQTLNSDPAIHGIIVQRPLPSHIDSHAISEQTNPQKDIDGFHTHSQFPMPLPLAVIEIVQTIFSTHLKKPLSFTQWLKEQTIVVVGKGETGGGPIIQLFQSKLGVEPLIIDTKTKNPEEILKKADIIISTAGKKGIITTKDLKKGVILIGVGMYKGEDGKLHPDYEQSEIESIASYYTPVPGGVGPVNVAKLLENLITSAEAKKNNHYAKKIS